VSSVAWDASGARLATGAWDRCVRIWDADSGAPRRVLEDDMGMVNAVAGHPADDLLASGSVDGLVRVWRFSSGELLDRRAGHVESVEALAASRDLFVSASFDQTVRVWSWADRHCLRVLDGFGNFCENSLAWRDGCLAARSMDDYFVATLHLWDARGAPHDWTPRAALPAAVEPADGVAVLEDGRVAVPASPPLSPSRATVALWARREPPREPSTA
jgi:WD40 repeat protein